MRLLLILTALAAAAHTDTPYWTDPETHLIWAAADNGSGISRLQAERFCRASTLGGFHDWRLPNIDELQSLYGGTQSENGRRVRGPITLTGWEWSPSSGEQPGEAWAFDFADGGRASVAGGDSGLNRALCVRSGAR
ncbi:MAG TPA: DUF1566 domain-containing protein [Bryobacteraceae bacterium]|jgi:hypothetical protein|nr:DUF1566 domain-containing protein [Bryobacteraceae bacterium]